MQTKFQRKAIPARIANRTPKGGLSCRKNTPLSCRWTSSDAFPVEFSYSATLTPTALYVHFSKTFDQQILAASANGNGSAVVLRERAGTSTQTASWSAPELANVRRNLLPGPPYEVVLRALALRTRDADFALISKQGEVGTTGTNGYVVASDRKSVV